MTWFRLMQSICTKGLDTQTNMILKTFQHQKFEIMLAEPLLADTDASKNDFSMLILTAESLQWKGADNSLPTTSRNRPWRRLDFSVMEKRGYKLEAIGSNLIFASTDLSNVHELGIYVSFTEKQWYNIISSRAGSTGWTTVKMYFLHYYFLSHKILDIFLMKFDMQAAWPINSVWMEFNLTGLLS